MKIITAESVTVGHPDKLSDYIADSILDACLKIDPDSRVACEVMLSGSKALIAGEITTNAKPDYIGIVKTVIESVGYNTDNLEIEVRIHEQSQDIAGAVFKQDEEQGAGDQGIVYGYACDESDEKMPLAIHLAHMLTSRLTLFREKGAIKGLRPDGKSQVSLIYDENDNVAGVKSVLISTQHEEGISQEELKKAVTAIIIRPLFENYAYANGIPELLITDETEILINPSGKFVLGGYEADTGLTGRKLMVDTYGGIAHHGGGAFSGKDPSKVDRSGAYMARYVAKNIVAAELATKCEVSIGYAIGKAQPTAVNIETFGTSIAGNDILREAVLRVFDLTPAGIIKTLDLKRPIYKRTATGGAFGWEEVGYPWEKTDKAGDLIQAVYALAGGPNGEE